MRRRWPDRAYVSRIEPSINFYLGEPNDAVREGLVSMLRGMGLRNLKAFADGERLITALTLNAPDIVLTSSTIHDELFPVLKRIRHHDLGHNPFTVMSVVIDADNKECLKCALRSGVDDILTAPLAAGPVMQRLEHLAFNRPQFIANPDYIGPDRRKDCPRDSKIPVFNVLNTLKDKIEGKQWPENKLQRAVSEQMGSVRTAQLEGFALKLGYLCKTVLEAYKTKAPTDGVRKNIVALKGSLEEAAQTAKKIDEEQLADICTNFARQVSQLTEHHDKPTPEDIKLLTTLTKAFQMARENISGKDKGH